VWVDGDNPKPKASVAPKAKIADKPAVKTAAKPSLKRPLPASTPQSPTKNKEPAFSFFGKLAAPKLETEATRATKTKRPPALAATRAIAKEPETQEKPQAKQKASPLGFFGINLFGAGRQKTIRLVRLISGDK
jgi:hypothetical protein